MRALNKMMGVSSRKTKRMRLAAVMAVLLVILCGCGKEAAETVPATEAAVVTTPAVVETTVPEYAVLTVDGTEDQGDVVAVTTSFGQLKYPFAFSDLIKISASNALDVAELNFIAQISGEEYPLFTIRFGGGEEDILLGTMEIPGEDAARNVYVRFGDVEEAALGEHLNTYLAAQEIFNDVVISLAENAGFTPAE